MSHLCCQIAISHSQRLILTTPEHSDQAGLCVSKQSPLRGHLSAVTVAKFNESRRDSGTAVALSTGPGRDRDTNVRERDGSGTHTGGSGTGAGELLVGTGGCGMV